MKRPETKYGGWKGERARDVPAYQYILEVILSIMIAVSGIECTPFKHVLATLSEWPGGSSNP